MTRFDLNARTHGEAEVYILGRAKQLLAHRAFLITMVRHDYGVTALFEMGSITYQAIYILSQHRGKGNFGRKLTELKLPVLTMDDCGMESYLRHNGIRHACLRSVDSVEYKLIEKAYGDKRAKRSGALYIDHIDEGLAVLEWIGATEEAKSAYCIHPIFQTDDDLGIARWQAHEWKECHPTAIVLAMEYRSIANEYLSPKSIGNAKDIRLSPLTEVNDMLVADKVQNRKDFELYHAETHPRREQLACYFRNWMERLEISEDRYAEFKAMLTLPRIVG